MCKGLRTKDKEPVAVKEIGGDTRENEWKIPASVRHPNILLFMDEFFFEHKVYVITELCDCDFRMILRLKKFSLNDTKVISRQLSNGYMALHCAGVIHGDIKPANILVKITANGLILKIADFGCGKMFSAKTIHTAPNYMPRKVLSSYCDARGDLLSIGLVLYESYFGQCFKPSKPFFAVTEELSLSQLQLETSISQNDEFDNLLLKMFQPNYKNCLSPTDYFMHPFHATIPHNAYLQIDNQFEVDDDSMYDALEDDDILLGSLFKVILKLFTRFF